MRVSQRGSVRESVGGIENGAVEESSEKRKSARARARENLGAGADELHDVDVAHAGHDVDLCSELLDLRGNRP